MGKIRHGMTNTRIWRIWRQMRRRCDNPNTKRYNRYGGRGIKVCSEWNNSFESFYEWAINNGYQENLTIDRIDNDKDYCPENCRWTTYSEQNRNRCVKSSTGIANVYLISGLYYGSVWNGKKNIYTKGFKSINECVLARDELRKTVGFS